MCVCCCVLLLRVKSVAVDAPAHSPLSGPRVIRRLQVGSHCMRVCGLSHGVEMRMNEMRMKKNTLSFNNRAICANDLSPRPTQAPAAGGAALRASLSAVV